MRIVEIVRFAETFLESPFVLLGIALVTETADIQLDLVGWRRVLWIFLHILYKSPGTLCITAIGIPSPAMQVWLLEPRSSYLQPSTFPSITERLGALISWFRTVRPHMTHSHLCQWQWLHRNPQEDHNISLETQVHHHLELSIERYLRGESSYPSRTTYWDQRNNTCSVSDSTFMMRFLTGVTSVIIGTSRPATTDYFRMSLRTNGPAVSVPIPTASPAPGLLISGRCATLTTNRLRSANKLCRWKTLWLVRLAPDF